MLHQAGFAPTVDVENAVRDLLDEDDFFDRTHNRSSHREHLVRPVTLQLRGSQEQILSFSRKVSVSGIGLITKVEIPERSTGVLTIETLTGPPVKFLAQCRSCRAYGKRWKLSTWQFVNVHR